MDNIKSRSTIPYLREDKPLVAKDGLSHVRDQLSPEEIQEVEKFPYRSIVGSLQYMQVHTGVTPLVYQ